MFFFLKYVNAVTVCLKRYEILKVPNSVLIFIITEIKSFRKLSFFHGFWSLQRPIETLNGWSYQDRPERLGLRSKACLISYMPIWGSPAMDHMSNVHDQLLSTTSRRSGWSQGRSYSFFLVCLEFPEWELIVVPHYSGRDHSHITVGPGTKFGEQNVTKSTASSKLISALLL